MFLSLNSFAKFIEEKEDYRKIECLNGYLKNPLIIELFQGNIFSDEAWPFVKEVDKYCSCEVKELIEEHKEKEKDWIAYSFRDKTKMLMKRDNCAVENFNGENISLHYRARFFQWFSPQIFTKIKDMNIQGMERFLPEDRYYNYMTCFHDKVSQKCSKVNSLNLTYSCIKKEFQTDHFYDNYNYCSVYLYEKSPIKDIDFSKLKEGDII